MKLPIKMLSVLLITLFALSTTSCETLEGAGQDIEKAGEAVQDAAN